MVAIGHWETLIGHGGMVRPLVAQPSEVSRNPCSFRTRKYINIEKLKLSKKAGD